MEYGKEYYSTPKLIFSKLNKCLRYALKEDVIDYLLVGTGNHVKIVGKGKYIVEVVHGQELFLSSFYPAKLGKTLAFGAVAVTAGVIGRMLISAEVAHLHMPSQI